MPHVEFYATPEGAEQYSEMAEGYDGREHIPVLRQLVVDGGRVLELGIGPGTDLELLATYFHVVGSDASQAFLDRYAADHADADLRLLDAVTIDTDENFDAIYSNKVLHHLDDAELEASLARQAQILNPGGVALHGIWKGDSIEDFEGMFVQNRTCESFMALAPSTLELIECSPYAEFDDGDSLRIVVRRVT